MTDAYWEYIQLSQEQLRQELSKKPSIIEMVQEKRRLKEWYMLQRVRIREVLRSISSIPVVYEESLERTIEDYRGESYSNSDIMGVLEKIEAAKTNLDDDLLRTLDSAQVAERVLRKGKEFVEKFLQGSLLNALDMLIKSGVATDETPLDESLTSKLDKIIF